MNNIEIGSLPEGHVILGYIAHLKVLDTDNSLYFAMRSKDLNDMEAYGLAIDMADTIRSGLQKSKEDPRDSD